MSDTEAFSNPCLKLADHRAIVGKPAAVEDLPDAPEQDGTVSDVGPANMYLSGKRGFATKYG
jgi:hypothetical protein